jgi:hypothetical protein
MRRALAVAILVLALGCGAEAGRSAQLAYEYWRPPPCDCFLIVWPDRIGPWTRIGAGAGFLALAGVGGLLARRLLRQAGAAPSADAAPGRARTT